MHIILPIFILLSITLHYGRNKRNRNSFNLLDALCYLKFAANLYFNMAVPNVIIALSTFVNELDSKGAH